MKENDVWLVSSLFCNNRQWHKLLKYGVEPFISYLNHKHDSYLFLIAFNYHLGPNVRLGIAAPADEAEKIAEEIDRYFKEVFKKYNFRAKKVIYPPPGFFLPFAENTIQYGLYKHPVIKKDYLFEAAFSKTLLIAMQEEPIDDGTLLVFNFYLQISLIKAFSALLPEKLLVGILFDPREARCDCASDHFRLISEKYIENKLILLEIYNDIIDFPAKDPKVSWLPLWLKACDMEIEKMKQKPKDEIDIKRLYDQMTHIINHRLGNTPSFNDFIKYFIKQISLEMIGT